MGYPPGKENNGSCLMQIERIVNKSIGMEIIAGVIKRHDDHDGAAQQIDRFDPVPGC